MTEVLKKFEQLVATGTQLAPQGGFEFSGYNARLQSKYLEWRKACLESLEQVGPIGFSYKNKILADQNGGFFFQASAQLILGVMKDVHEKLRASPDLASAPPPPAAVHQASASTMTETTVGTKILRPPPKPVMAQPAHAQPPPAQSPGGGSTRVYVIGEKGDQLREQLTQFIKELGLEEFALDREHGKMIALDNLQDKTDIRYAFFIIKSEDLAYAMFEIGHFVGKLGNNHVCVLHMADVNFPKGVPGVAVRPIVVKLEEASFSVMKDLKAAGYKISI